MQEARHKVLPLPSIPARTATAVPAAVAAAAKVTAAAAVAVTAAAAVAVAWQVLMANAPTEMARERAVEAT